MWAWSTSTGVPRGGGSRRGGSQPPFRLLAVVQAAHAAGDALVAVALANTLFFSVPLGEARSKVALYLALALAPFAVLSPLVAPWLDRRRGSYRAAIVAAMIGRVVLAILLSSRTDRLYLYPLAFGLLVLSRVHGVSRSALVPDALPPGRSLMWANARLAVISVAGGTLGGGPALALTHWVGPSAALWTAAATFGVGALVAVRLPPGGTGDRPEPRAGSEGALRTPRVGSGRTPLTPRPGVEARWAGRTDRPRVGSGRALLTPRLLAGGVAMTTLRGTVGFTTFLLAFLLKTQGEGGRALVIVVVAAGAGALVGSLAAPALRAVLRELPLLYAALAVAGVPALWAASHFTATRAAVLAVLVGLAAAAGRVAFDSLVQQDAPEQVRARTFARYETIFQLAWVLGAGLATAVPFGPVPGLWTLAGLCVAGVALAASPPLRSRVVGVALAGLVTVGRGAAAGLRSVPARLRRRLRRDRDG